MVGVYGFPDDDPNSLNCLTLCGTAIKVGNALTGREATLGGIIEVQWDDGRSKLFGLTAGHILLPSRADEAEIGETSEGTLEDTDSGLGEEPMDDASFELELQVQPEEGPTYSDSKAEMDNFQTMTQVVEQRPLTWPKFGSVSAAAREIQTKQNFDWALIELDNPLLYKANYLVSSLAVSSLRAWNEPVSASFSTPHGHTDKGVAVLDRNGSCRQGILTCSRSYLMAAPSHSFIKTYDLTLSPGSGNGVELD